MIPKIEWRRILEQRRREIPAARQLEASLLCKELLQNKGRRILSFSPIGSEIDLNPLNELLRAQNRLVLVAPKANQPIEVCLEGIDCILVPGLGFDRNKMRIGYGKGHYDRFLAQVKTIHTIGVGFKEQFCEELFPKDPWDVSVKELCLC